MRTDAEVIVEVVGIADPTSPDPVAQWLHREHAGRYLVSYDHRTPAGEPPRLETTADRSKATRFPSLKDWHERYTASYGVRPWDGAPNRPITAFNLEITSAEDPGAMNEIAERLEYLRAELRAERISYGELAELQSLRDEIDPSDVELLEAAGVPEDEYRARGGSDR